MEKKKNKFSEKELREKGISYEMYIETNFVKVIAPKTFV